MPKKTKQWTLKQWNLSPESSERYDIKRTLYQALSARNSQSGSTNINTSCLNIPPWVSIQLFIKLILTGEGTGRFLVSGIHVALRTGWLCIQRPGHFIINKMFKSNIFVSKYLYIFFSFDWMLKQLRLFGVVPV